jgi:transcription elongation factor Elf1
MPKSKRRKIIDRQLVPYKSATYKELLECGHVVVTDCYRNNKERSKSRLCFECGAGA